jgi:hypothetical protein
MYSLSGYAMNMVYSVLRHNYCLISVRLRLDFGVFSVRLRQESDLLSVMARYGLLSVEDTKRVIRSCKADITMAKRKQTKGQTINYVLTLNKPYSWHNRTTNTSQSCLNTILKQLNLDIKLKKKQISVLT